LDCVNCTTPAPGIHALPRRPALFWQGAGFSLPYCYCCRQPPTWRCLTRKSNGEPGC